MGIPRVGCHSLCLQPQSHTLRLKRAKNPAPNLFKLPGQYGRPFPHFPLLTDKRTFVLSGPESTLSPARWSWVEQRSKAQPHHHPGYQTPWDHQHFQGDVVQGANNSYSTVLPWKTRLSQLCSTPRQPLVIFLPSTSKDTNWLIYVVFFHSLLSVYKMPFAIFPSTHYSVHSESSSLLVSYMMSRGYKSTVVSQRLYFHKQPHPSNFLSGVLWRILFILYLSCLDCKLIRIRTFLLFVPCTAGNVAGATWFTAFKDRRDHCNYLVWPSAYHMTNFIKWLLH